MSSKKISRRSVSASKSDSIDEDLVGDLVIRAITSATNELTLAKTNAEKKAKEEEINIKQIDNILFQQDISKSITKNNLYELIIKFLYNKNGTKYLKNIKKIINFLKILSDKNLSKIDNDKLKTPIGITSKDELLLHNYNGNRNNIFFKIADEFLKNISLGKADFNKQDLFNKFSLFNKEDKQHFITIDPTIIQIMIFDDEEENDIVYSLKLIMRNDDKTFNLRYTTMLFPDNSEIKDFNDLKSFNKYNIGLGNDYIKTKYETELKDFFKKYIKFYELYKKCYNLDIEKKKIIDYGLKYISILGKARFSKTELCVRTGKLTDYIMSNLLITNPSYGFISGGYKGFKQNAYGITRSGYEIAKKYNRPILTIMCKEGLHDSHEYSDALLIYGEHWGEDTIALSQLTDGAVIIAPFGGWTYIECLSLLKQEKIVVIYNDFYNILNYKNLSFEEQKFEKVKLTEKVPGLLDNIYNSMIIEKNNNLLNNKYFFMFASSEQNSIIDYYINYYLILLHLDTDKKIPISDKLEETIISLTSLKDYFNHFKEKYQETYNIKLILNNIKKEFIDEIKKTDKLEIKLFDEEIFIYNELKKKTIEDNIYNKYISKYIEYFDKEKKKKEKLPIENTIIKLPIENTIIKLPSKYLPGNLIDLINKIESHIIDREKNFIRDNESIIRSINKININKSEINKFINENKVYINGHYLKKFYDNTDSNYQREIPDKCDGIWIKPTFNFIDDCIKVTGTEIKITLDNKHKIFKNLNKNIIFVFSDIMYLSNYLNKNLNKANFQKKIQYKINKINMYDTGDKNKSYKDLLKLETQINFGSLNRSIDGIYNTDEGRIVNQHIIQDDYMFIIEDICEDYTDNIVDRKYPTLSEVHSAHAEERRKILQRPKTARPTRHQPGI